MNTLVKRSRVKSDYERDDTPPPPIGHWIGLSILFCLALALRVWYNFCTAHVNNYGSCDASEYLRNAGTLLNLHLPPTFLPDAWNVLIGHASQAQRASVQQSLAGLKDFSISGPTFPVFLAGCYLASFQTFNMETWIPPVVGNCIVSALTAVFVALIGNHTFNKKTGYLAGALCAVYPAFIVNSGRLYSETFAACLLSALCYMTVRRFCVAESAGDSLRSGIVTGALAAGLQFTRSIMLVMSLALVPIAFLQQGMKKGVVAVVGLLIGFACIAAPWLVTQKLAFGTSSLLLDRVGHYNFFIGNNVDTAGWLSYPYPDGRGVDQRPMPQLAKEAISRSPGRWIKLQQDKPLRLLKFPWNDFRSPIGEIGFLPQVLFHQAILILAAVGLVLGFVSREDPAKHNMGYDKADKQARPATAAKIFLIFTLLLHASYLLFITVPRYNLTAMPLLMVFAAAGVTSIWTLCMLRRGAVAAGCVLASATLLLIMAQLSATPWLTILVGTKYAVTGLVLESAVKLWCVLLLAVSLWFAVSRQTDERLAGHNQARGKLIARSLIVTITVACIVTVALPSRANGRWDEWQATLRAGEVATQQFAVPADFSKNLSGRQLYLLVDGDSAGQLQSANFAINGQAIDAPRIPAIALTDDFSRFQKLPKGGYMREGEWVFDCLTQSAGIKNADLRQWFVLPIANEMLLNKSVATVQIANRGASPISLYGSFDLGGSTSTIPSVGVYSWEKAFYGVENTNQLTDTRFDEKIRPLGVGTSHDLSSTPGMQSGRFHIQLLTGPPQVANTTVYTVERDPQAPSVVIPLYKATGVGMLSVRDSSPRHSYKLQEIPVYGQNDWWVVRITGAARRTAGSGVLDFGVKAVSADPKQPYVSPWSPTTTLSTNWQHFDVSIPVVPGKLGAPLQQIACDVIVRNPRTAQVGNLNVDAATELKDVSMQISRLPNNPLSSGHVVY